MMLKDPKYPRAPGYIIDEVFGSIQETHFTKTKKELLISFNTSIDVYRSCSRFSSIIYSVKL